jgi:protein involved in polysaccharide export with SLBB domain
MKKFLLAIILIVPLYSLAQDFDSDYLDSLPEDVREDVLKEVEKKEDQEKPVYRKPSSKVNKDLMNENHDGYYIEDKNKEEEEEDRRFGAKFFSMMQSSFMPINEPNFDSTYILDFGDVLEVQLIGQINEIDEIIIKRDGSINISDIGKINVSGLSLDTAISLIKNKVKNSFIGTDVFVSLVNIRDIQVVVSGNAYQPGIYTVSGNANAFHVLSMAGGISDEGSYRTIKIIRDNKIVETLDLYDIFIYGKSSFGPQLRSGDTIFVEHAKILVDASLGVNRKNIYEMKEGETFEKLIYFANGFKSSANPEFISVDRLSNGQIKKIDLSMSNLSSTYPKNQDSLYIREFKYGSINIEGSVVQPGIYSITDGETLSSLIKRAGGYSQSAYTFGGFLNNKKAEEINESARAKLYNRFLMGLISSPQLATGESKNLSFLLKQLKNADVSGRIVAEFNIDIIAEDPMLDTLLEDGDEIYIPKITQQVYIYGEINNEGTIRYSSGKDLDYYINNSGGLMGSADKKNIFIVHPNGETQVINSSRSGFFARNNMKDDLIYPGSIIFIPKSLDLENAQVASLWAPIVSSLAVSLTSLSILNDR